MIKGFGKVVPSELLPHIKAGSADHARRQSSKNEVSECWTNYNCLIKSEGKSFEASVRHFAAGARLVLIDGRSGFEMGLFVNVHAVSRRQTLSKLCERNRIFDNAIL